MTASVTSVVAKFYEEYSKTTPSKLKLIDAYLFYILLTGIVQFLYCCLVGTFPFNSFLSGFISCVGSFVLAGKFASFIQKYNFMMLILNTLFLCIYLYYCNVSMLETSSQS